MISLLFKIGADATGVDRAVAGAAKRGEAAFKSMGREISGRLAGFFTAGYILDAIGGWVRSTADWADNLGDVADNLGISVEEVQRFEAAAQLGGARITKMRSALEAVAALQSQALGGDKRARGLFSILGIDPNGMNPLQLMQAIADASGNGARQLAAAGDIFGKKMQGVLNTMQKMQEVANIDVASQAQIDKIGQAMDQMQRGLHSLLVASADIIVRVFQIIGAYAEGIGESIKVAKAGGFMEFTKEFYGGNYLLRSRDAYMRMQQTQAVAGGAAANPTRPQIGSISASPIPLAMQSDALSRIGLFVGGSGDVGSQLVTIGNYQLSELRAIRANMEHANR